MKKFDAYKKDDAEEFDFVTNIKNTLNLASDLKMDDINTKIDPRIKFGIFTRSKFKANNKNQQIAKNIRTTIKNMK